MNILEVERRAQTNLQLYAQLLGAGIGIDQVAFIRDCYALAARLFAGQLRPEGRPFLCHVVGVASILAMSGVPPETIAAGLLHSAYSHGDFGFGRGQRSRNARDEVAGVVGPQVEAVVASYSELRWNAELVEGLIANPERLGADERQLLWIRLADSAEDALDFGLQLSAKPGNPHRDITPQMLVALSEALGFMPLAASLERILITRKVDFDLSRLRDHHAGTYVVGPASWREKIAPRLLRVARRAR
jgi:(p)ppGpp synthase/HD superfamily hydrolase